MKLITAATLALLALPALAAHAGEPYSDSRFFSPHERATPYGIGLGPIDGRYPRPASSVHGLNIPNGAGAPVPLDPFSIGGRYAEGETAAPFTYVVDAKGRATEDAKGRAAWDGSYGRMTYGN